MIYALENLILKHYAIFSTNRMYELPGTRNIFLNFSQLQYFEFHDIENMNFRTHTIT